LLYFVEIDLHVAPPKKRKALLVATTEGAKIGDGRNDFSLSYKMAGVARLCGGMNRGHRDRDGQVATKKFMRREGRRECLGKVVI